MNIPALIAALMLAEVAALGVDAADSTDGGTCNFDTCVLTPAAPVRQKTLDEIKAATGITLTKEKWLGKIRLFVGTTTRGQGDRRTRMAEAACEVLKREGFDAMMYMQMD